MGNDFFYTGSQTDTNLQKACLEFVYQVARQILCLDDVIQGQPYLIPQDFVPDNSLILFAGRKGQENFLPSSDNSYEQLETIQLPDSNGKFGDLFIEIYRIKQFSFQGVVPFSGTDFWYKSQFVFEPTRGRLITLDSALLYEPSITRIKNYYAKFVGAEYLEKTTCFVQDFQNHREIYNYDAYASFLKYIQTHFVPNLDVHDDYFDFKRINGAALKHIKPDEMIEMLLNMWTEKGENRITNLFRKIVHT